MGMNISKGNMFEWITHTFNVIKGACYHDCSYCYMKRWGKLNPVRFDKKELKTDLGKDNFIFVGSSNDMFVYQQPITYGNILDILNHLKKFNNNYFFQTKNPFGLNGFIFPEKSTFGTTIETNRFYKKIMGNAPETHDRAFYLYEMASAYKKYVTIEPIMDFDLVDLVRIIQMANPVQVNIGADTGNNNLPEPSKEKILQLIDELQKFTIIHNKKNLKRLLT